MKCIKIFPIILLFLFITEYPARAHSSGKASFKKADTGCKVECIFGSCECKTSGAGGGCVCTCVWGFPVCGGGGGGKGNLNVYQLHTFADFSKVIATFESTQGLELQKNCARYLEIMKEEEDPFEIVQAIKGNIERLLPEEREQVIDFLLSKGETELSR